MRTGHGVLRFWQFWWRAKARWRETQPRPRPESRDGIGYRRHRMSESDLGATDGQGFLEPTPDAESDVTKQSWARSWSPDRALEERAASNAKRLAEQEEQRRAELAAAESLTDARSTYSHAFGANLEAERALKRRTSRTRPTRRGATGSGQRMRAGSNVLMASGCMLTLIVWVLIPLLLLLGVLIYALVS
jgi:hypothetical protein